MLDYMTKLTSKATCMMWFNAAINLRVSGFTSALDSVLNYFKMNSNQIEEAQYNNAKEILGYAMRCIPYYRVILKNQIPRKVEEFWQCWKTMPTTNRQTIKTNFQSFVSRKQTGDPFYNNQTSGSTGHPIQFWQCYDFLRHQIVGNFVASRMTGYEYGDVQCYLWSSQYNPNLSVGVLERLETWITRTKYFDFSIISPYQIRQIAINICRLKPDIVYGYPSVLVALAKVMEENGFYCTVKSVESCGEPLTQSQRQIIIKSFSAPVYDKYGAREVGTIAHECFKHNGMHIFSFNNLVEIINSKGEPVRPGELGQIVVTNLHNHAMPLIRYDIGDYGRFLSNRCTCGLNTPLLGSVEGRKSDIIVLEDGSLIFPEFFYDLFSKLNDVYKYQIVQESPRELIIYLVARPWLTKSSTRYIERWIKNKTQEKVKISINLCDDIPRLRSGKHRYIISQSYLAK